MKFYTNRQLDEQSLKDMLAVLAKGDRVLIIPVKDGVRIFKIRKYEI